MRPLFTILEMCAAACFCRVAAQDIPQRLTVSNGNAASWDNPYPSACLDARTLSFPMRGIPRP